MIHFLFLGLWRDKHRSLFPILVVAAGTSLCVLLQAWMDGEMNSIVDHSVNFQKGHVRITTKAYQEFEDQKPNDLAVLGSNSLIEGLADEVPNLNWAPRIYFGGLLDLGDESGETLKQSPILGIAIDFDLNQETQRLSLDKGLTRGHFPRNHEVLVSVDLMEQLGLTLDDSITIISSTMDGSMAVANFKISGSVTFGMKALDRSGIVLDIREARSFLNMPDGASEILGFFDSKRFNSEASLKLQQNFNDMQDQSDESFPLTMSILSDDPDLSMMMSLGRWMNIIVVSAFVFIMSIILWNAGLLNGLRRHGEFGLRLALGESAKTIYQNLIVESIIIGVIGAILGTLLGLIPSYYLQENGLNIAEMMSTDLATIVIADTIYARISGATIVVGLVPGLIANCLGAAIAGRAIFKRSTAQLFKELEQ
ncbi:ABC transporter permease [Pseudobacteriovorax antillogorgiicola]|uniref:Putative ABC transport system permease protein n=1 Tax=Pseudobacteriovorax antillogorgiicola TaxID=1513793 RepID=A0A1Y6CCZ8_9BACT|nr:FtsX-like permease family protein [Pseudobacteriovorax antillogorgiicola]TCS48317.1 putative ABC transport system permease protein [Pseudobacteriovorax antillogorgiicola]SMF56626.1 putative ABC transport system permease protein [Pseudobacteriovorax antillogorgiicola]